MKLTRCVWNESRKLAESRQLSESRQLAETSGFLPRSTINPCPKSISWFPGHMGKGLKRLQMMTRSADCVIEIHDARIPFTSRNYIANRAYEGKPRIVLLNKADLVEEHEIEGICSQISVRESIPVVPTWFTCDRKMILKQIVRDGHTMVNSHQLTVDKDKYLYFVSGIPNVGKSTFINIFKKGTDSDRNILQVAPHAAVTKNISNKVRIMRNPLTYIYDTPGINLPRPQSIESAMKLAIVGCIPYSIPGVVETCDYLLYWLNKKGRYEYAAKCGLTGPSNNIIEVLAYLARRRDLMLNGKPVINTSGQHFLQLFNKGEFGKIILEEV